MNNFGLPPRKQPSLLWAGLLGLVVGALYWLLLFFFFVVTP